MHWRHFLQGTCRVSTSAVFVPRLMTTLRSLRRWSEDGLPYNSTALLLSQRPDTSHSHLVVDLRNAPELLARLITMPMRSWY